MRKITALVLILMYLLVGGAVAFGAGATESNTDARPTLSVMVYERGQVPTHVGTLQENPWVDYIREQTGIDVQYVPVPRWEVGATLNPLFAAGAAPDIVSDYSRGSIEGFQRQGVLAPLDDWLEQYSTVVRDYLHANPSLDPYLRFGDANELYAVSNVRSVDSIANHMMWIRKDWLDNLGLAVPTTIEEFYAVADAFVTQDPNRSGQNDTFAIANRNTYVPVTWAISAAVFKDWYVDDSGRVELGLLTERAIDVLTFRKTAFTRGWEDPELITDTNFVRQRRLWATGMAGIFMAQHDPPDLKELIENNPNAEIVPVPALQTRYGRFGYWQEPPANRFVALNAQIRDPSVAFQYLDWMMAEGWFSLAWGLEGEHHEIVPQTGLPRLTVFGDEYLDQLWYNYEYPILTQAAFIPFMQRANLEDPFEVERARLQQLGLEAQLEVPFRRDMPYRPSTRELSNFYDEFDPIFDDIFLQVVYGDRSPQWGHERIVAEFERLGGREVQAMVQEWYDQNQPEWQTIDWRFDSRGELARLRAR